MTEKRLVKAALFPEKHAGPVYDLLDALKNKTLKIPGRIDELRSPDMTKEQYAQEKRVIYALCAYFLEQIHQFTTFEEPGHEGEVKVYDVLESLPEPHFKKTYIPLDAFPTDAETDILGPIKQLRDAYASVFADALHRWSAHIDAKDPDDYDRRAYVWFSRLVEYKAGISSTTAERFLFRGGHTAGEVSWDILRSIPIAFERKYGRTITPEEFRAIGEAAEPMANLLSRMHIHNFTNLMRAMRQDGKRENINIGLEFPMEFFHLSEEKNGSPKVEFDEIALRSFMTYAEESGRSAEDDRLGCPAHDVDVQLPNGASEDLVEHVYGKYRAIAEKVLVPNLERYTKEMKHIANLSAPKPDGIIA